MKKHSNKKLYNIVIKKLLEMRFYKGEEKYLFSYWAYKRGVYEFCYIPERDKEKSPIYDNVKLFAIRLYWQQMNDYKNTVDLNCQCFDKCEIIA